MQPCFLKHTLVSSYVYFSRITRWLSVKISFVVLHSTSCHCQFIDPLYLSIFCANTLVSFRFQKIINAKGTQAGKAAYDYGCGFLVIWFGDYGANLNPKLDIPDITPISGAVWSIGIFSAIVKYKLLSMNPAFIADNLFETIIDSVILADPDGFMLSANT